MTVEQRINQIYFGIPNDAVGSPPINPGETAGDGNEDGNEEETTTQERLGLDEMIQRIVATPKDRPYRFSNKVEDLFRLLSNLPPDTKKRIAKIAGIGGPAIAILYGLYSVLGGPKSPEQTIITSGGKGQPITYADLNQAIEIVMENCGPDSPGASIFFSDERYGLRDPSLICYPPSMGSTTTASYATQPVTKEEVRQAIEAIEQRCGINPRGADIVNGQLNCFPHDRRK